MKTEGTVYFHYQDDIARMGRAVARATPTDEGMEWRVFPASMSDDEIAQQFAPACYCGPGRYFAKEPRIRRGVNRVLATQMFGLDI